MKKIRLISLLFLLSYLANKAAVDEHCRQESMWRAINYGAVSTFVPGIFLLLRQEGIKDGAELVVVAAMSAAENTMVSEQFIDMAYPDSQRRKLGRKRFLSNIVAAGWVTGSILIGQHFKSVPVFLQIPFGAGVAGTVTDIALEKYCGADDQASSDPNDAISRLQAMQEQKHAEQKS